MAVTVIIGGQWGDEGKGKLVDIIAQEQKIIARYNGGANAGHTIVLGKKKFATNLLPSGILTPNCINLIGNGLVVEIPKLLDELDQLHQSGVDTQGRIFVSDRSHIVFGFHKEIDGLQEAALNEEKIGTTKKGIGPAYSSKATRNGIRVGELLFWDSFEKRVRSLFHTLMLQYKELETYDIETEIKAYKEVYAPRVLPMILDTITYLHKALKAGEKILVEGANAVMLDLDFGTYPYVTSSSPCSGGACTGLGIPPSSIKQVFAVVKAYTTRVGSGPFPTELEDELGVKLRDKGHEYGTTTGRPRRCGWMDAIVVRYGHKLNDYTAICLTKLDVLDTFDEIKVAVKYEYEGKELQSVPANVDILSKVHVTYLTFKGWKKDISQCRSFSDLPQEAQDYVLGLEKIFEVPIRWIGVGPEREAIIHRNNSNEMTL
jgi:adenylosuccinate synthase